MILADMVSFLCREGATFESHIRQDMNVEHEGRYLTICVLPVRQDDDDTPIWWAWTTEEQYDAMTADSNDKPKGAEFYPWNEAAVEFDEKTSARTAVSETENQVSVTRITLVRLVQCAKIYSLTHSHTELLDQAICNADEALGTYEKATTTQS